MINEAMFTSKTNEWATPQAFFDELNKEFDFTLDPCATPENAKCARFFTKEIDGLAQSWRGETVFCNPPYGRDLSKWVAKAHAEVVAGGGTTVVMLIPARTDTAYFHDYIYQKHAIRFIRGRLHFNESKSAAPFPSMVVVMRPSDADNTGGAIMDKKAGLIYYVCDRTACAHCSPDCKHTSNIAHAKNFTPADINGKYPVKDGNAAIFIERIEETSTAPTDTKATIIGVDLAIGNDHTAGGGIYKPAPVRQNDCPMQLQDGDEWICGKVVSDVRVVCPEMLDFRACGDYPYKMRKKIYEEIAREHEAKK